MTIRACFIGFNYLLANLGVVCLIFSEIYPPPVNSMILTGLLACLILENWKLLPIPSPAKLSIWKTGLFFATVFYLFVDLPLLTILVSFLILILFIRLIFKTELNDYLYGYMINIVCLLIGAIYIKDLIFGVLFLLFYLILCWALILYNQMVERVGNNATPNQFRNTGTNETICTSLFGLSAGLVLISLTLTTIIFISFPRIELGLFSLNTVSNPIIGFSQNVTLGDVGKIKKNDQIVMRIQFFKDNQLIRPNVNHLWRGVALDKYDGTSWSSTAKIEMNLKNRPGKGLNLFTPNTPSSLIRQEIFMETFDSDIVFTRGIPVFLDGTFRAMQIDNNYIIRTTDSSFGPKKFIMVSDVSRKDISFPFATPFMYNGVFLSRYLQLPEVSERLAELPETITGSKGSFKSRADKILSYFQKDFGYTLEMIKETERSSLDEFLFHRKKGHCEYFASAMVVLLRLEGIPARLVNGFVGSEWNALGKYMVIRQQHAHSWVEAFLPGLGWKIYDPTPPDPEAVTVQTDQLSLYMDLLRLNWQRYVISYSFKDQARVLNFFRGRSLSFTQKLKNLKSTSLIEIWQSLPKNKTIGGVAFLTIFWLTVSFLQKTGVFRKKNPPPFAVMLYQRMLKQLEKSGIHKKPGWTHREFLSHLGSLPDEQKSIVKKITDFYEKVRFGQGSCPSEKDQTDWLRLLLKGRHMA